MWLAETEEWTRDLFEFQQLTTNQVLCATSFSLTRFVFVGEREPEGALRVCMGESQKGKASEREREMDRRVCARNTSGLRGQTRRGQRHTPPPPTPPRLNKHTALAALSSHAHNEAEKFLGLPHK